MCAQKKCFFIFVKLAHSLLHPGQVHIRESFAFFSSIVGKAVTTFCIIGLRLRFGVVNTTDPCSVITRLYTPIRYGAANIFHQSIISIKYGHSGSKQLQVPTAL